jgi:RHS repeat-associated protein
VTAVTDPFGRKALFAYSADGHLTNITDPVNITSSYTWAANDFISQLATPYGITKFASVDGFTTQGNFARSLTITDPLGLTSRVDYVQLGPTSGTGIPDSDPQNTVPQKFGISVTNQFLSWRNAFVWNPDQLSLATHSDGSVDYTKARIMHFLHQGFAVAVAAPILESMKNPLENRVWYTYPNQIASMYAGTSNKPYAVARVLDDGTTQLTNFERNSFGKVTQLTDPVGRQFTYGYASNGIDLVSASATTGGANLQMFSATYNAAHEPLTVTDSAGETSTVTYNSNNQLLAVSNALHQTIQYNYDTNSFITSVQVILTSPPTGTPQLSAFTYDGYDRVKTITDELGYTKTIVYDLVNRPTTIAFPDGTADNLTYQVLDLASVTDRLGHTTSYQHDADRRLISIKDPLGRTTQFGYCTCGAISEIIDPVGNTTNFHFDLEDRITSRQYADGSQTLYKYEATTSRLKSLTDGNGQGASYTYNADNTLNALAAPSSPAVPLVSFTYDPVFNRRQSIKDTFGTTTYTYNPTFSGTPLLGGGQLESEQGPFGDVISYKYDALGRRISRSVGPTQATESSVFDGLGRLSSVTNPLGVFLYSYLGASGRVSAVTSLHLLDGVGAIPALAESATYYGVDRDNLPKTISWSGAQGLLASFNYAYDAQKEITQITFEGNGVNLGGSGSSSGPSSYQVNYDGDGELLGVTPVGNQHGGISYAYTYSPAFNILSMQVGNTAANLTYNNLNQLATTSISFEGGGTLRPTAGVSYDGAGNLSTLGKTKYGWIPAVSSRPVSLAEPDWNLATIQYSNGTTNFQYDGLGRCTEISDNINGATVTKRYLWDGFTICQEYDMTSANASNPGGIVTKRYFAQGVQINGSPYYYTSDVQGSIIHLIDANGIVESQYRYDPYGNQDEVVSGNIKSDIGYTGMFQHRPSGLSLAVFRPYSPGMGRWLSRDPLGEFANLEHRQFGNRLAFAHGARFNATDLNLYAYARNNPTSLRDPSGLQSCPEQEESVDDSGSGGGRYRTSLGLFAYGGYSGVTAGGYPYTGSVEYYDEEPGEASIAPLLLLGDLILGGLAAEYGAAWLTNVAMGYMGVETGYESYEATKSGNE